MSIALNKLVVALAGGDARADEKGAPDQSLQGGANGGGLQLSDLHLVRSEFHEKLKLLGRSLLGKIQGVEGKVSTLSSSHQESRERARTPSTDPGEEGGDLAAALAQISQVLLEIEALRTSTVEHEQEMQDQIAGATSDFAIKSVEMSEEIRRSAAKVKENSSSTKALTRTADACERKIREQGVELMAEIAAINAAVQTDQHASSQLSTAFTALNSGTGELTERVAQAEAGLKTLKDSLGGIEQRAADIDKQVREMTDLQAERIAAIASETDQKMNSMASEIAAVRGDVEAATARMETDARGQSSLVVELSKGLMDQKEANKKLSEQCTREAVRVGGIDTRLTELKAVTEDFQTGTSGRFDLLEASQAEHEAGILSCRAQSSEMAEDIRGQLKDLEQYCGYSKLDEDAFVEEQTVSQSLAENIETLDGRISSSRTRIEEALKAVRENLERNLSVAQDTINQKLTGAEVRHGVKIDELVQVQAETIAIFKAQRRPWLMSASEQKQWLSERARTITELCVSFESRETGDSQERSRLVEDIQKVAEYNSTLARTALLETHAAGGDGDPAAHRKVLNHAFISLVAERVCATAPQPTTGQLKRRAAFSKTMVRCLSEASAGGSDTRGRQPPVLSCIVCDNPLGA